MWNSWKASLFQEFLSQIVILVLAVTAGKVVRSRQILADETAIRLRLAEEERTAEAARVGIPAFEAMQVQRAALRERIYRETGHRLQTTTPGPMAPAARTIVEHALIHGSPDTVAEALSRLAAIGIGGLILQFRLGPMPYDVAARSLTLFTQKVWPAVQAG